MKNRGKLMSVYGYGNFYNIMSKYNCIKTSFMGRYYNTDTKMNKNVHHYDSNKLHIDFVSYETNLKKVINLNVEKCLYKYFSFS